jgi:hypothetical protein
MSIEREMEPKTKISTAWAERCELKIAVPLAYRTDDESIVPFCGMPTLRAIDGVAGCH